MTYFYLHELATNILMGLGAFVEEVLDFMSYTIPGVGLTTTEVMFGSGVAVYLALRVVFS